jgi:hypothetical protein
MEVSLRVYQFYWKLGKMSRGRGGQFHTSSSSSSFQKYHPGSTNLSANNEMNVVGDDETMQLPPDFATAVLSAIADAMHDIKNTYDSEATNIGSNTLLLRHITNFGLPEISKCTTNKHSYEISIPLQNVQQMASFNVLKDEIQKRGRYTVDIALESTMSGVQAELIVSPADETVMLFRKAVASIRNDIEHRSKPIRRTRRVGVIGRVVKILFLILVFSVVMYTIYVTFGRSSGNMGESQSSHDTH